MATKKKTNEEEEVEEVKVKKVEKEMTPHEKDEAERMKIMVDKAAADQKAAKQGNHFGQ